nr:hypothetical protein GCM10020093_114190 [Planobispora longispora]
MIAAVRAVMRYDVPVVAKLSPDTADIVSVARACAASGADALSMINNPLGMSIDTETMLPRSRRAPAGCRDRPSARWPYAACGRSAPPCPTCPSSAWAAC